MFCKNNCDNIFTVSLYTIHHPFNYLQSYISVGNCCFHHYTAKGGG